MKRTRAFRQPGVRARVRGPRIPSVPPAQPFPVNIGEIEEVMRLFIKGRESPAVIAVWISPQFHGDLRLPAVGAVFVNVEDLARRREVSGFDESNDRQRRVIQAPRPPK